MRPLPTLLLVLVLVGAASAVTGSARAQVAFTFVAGDQGAVTPLGVTTDFRTTIHNTGSIADTYTLNMAKDVPADWTCSLCQGTVCYPPFVTQLTFHVAAGAQTTVDVDLTPLVTDGHGTVHVTVTSQADPALMVARDFLVVSSGVEMLLVDGDGGLNLENWFTPALAGSGLTWALWERHVAGVLDQMELEGFEGVIWFSDGMAPALDEEDQAALAYYVQHGGDLLLCGQDVVQQGCDPASPWYSEQSASWFSTVLGVGWAGPATGAVSVITLAASPFARSQSAWLSGADGAGNGTSPDALTSVGSGVLAQIYGTGVGAGVTSTWGAGRSYVCGYALEATSPAAFRNDFLDGFLDWASGQATAVPDLRTAAGAVQVAPNPFNPSTALRFDLAQGGRVRVDICDVRGRLVRRLADETRPAGPVTLVWDGRDAVGGAAASGLYVARVEAPGGPRTVKLVLAK